MKLTITTISLLSMFIFSSCKEKQNEDITTGVNKSGSVETIVSTEHADSLNDILITKYKVWVHGSEYKQIEHRDTVPALGLETKTAENKDGDTKSVTVKKDYEIYITIR